MNGDLAGTLRQARSSRVVAYAIAVGAVAVATILKLRYADWIGHDVPVATAYSSRDIFADPHMAARGDLVEVMDPVVGGVRQQAPYPRFVGESPNIPSGAPKLGEHTATVLRELLHLDAAAIDDLAQRGIIA